MEHAFNVNIAKEYDIDTALFLQHLKFWTFRNLANKKHIHDGLCWTYSTQEALSDIFPYWTRRQIQRVINNCINKELIIKGNYNKSSYDRTNWYALTNKCYWLFPELADEKYLKLLYLSVNANKTSPSLIEPNGAISNCLSAPNGAMEFTEWCNEWPRSVQPIPDTKTDTKTDITTTNDFEPVSSSKSFFEDYKIKELEALEKLSNDFDIAKKKKEFKEESLSDAACIAMYRNRFATADVTLEQLYEDCCDYWSQKDQMVYKARFLTHLKKCPISNYPEKETVDFKKAAPTELDKQDKENLALYSNYVNQVRSDIRLKLLPENTKCMDFEQWINTKHCTVPYFNKRFGHKNESGSLDCA